MQLNNHRKCFRMNCVIGNIEAIIQWDISVYRGLHCIWKTIKMGSDHSARKSHRPPFISSSPRPFTLWCRQAGRQAGSPPSPREWPSPCSTLPGLPFAAPMHCSAWQCTGSQSNTYIRSHKMQDKVIEKLMQFDLDGVLALLHYTMDMHWVQNSQSARCIPQCSEIQNDWKIQLNLTLMSAFPFSLPRCIDLLYQTLNYNNTMMYNTLYHESYC